MKKILIQTIIISLFFVIHNAKANIKSITEGNVDAKVKLIVFESLTCCLLYTSPSPRDATLSRMPSSA